MTLARDESGFTMIELMMAVLIMGIVTGQLFMVFSSQKRTFTANQRVLDVQEDARLVADLVGFDARNAGFMVPGSTSMVSIDGGTTASDRVCISDSSYFEYPVSGGGTTQLDDRDTAFDGAETDSAVLSTSFASDDRIVLDSLDIDGDGTNDFQVDAGVILSNGTRFGCAQIASITGTTVEFIDDHDMVSADWRGDGLTIDAVPAIIYELDGLSLQRNGLVLATNVEDLQVEYWIDGYDNPGTTEDERENGEIEVDEIVHDLNATPPTGVTIDPALIRRATIGVITRTSVEEADAQGLRKVTSFARRPALANRVEATQGDGFQRRRFSASVMPRNLN